MRGVFQAEAGHSFAEISDGLSNTFLAGEKQVGRDRFGHGPTDCSIYDGGRPTCSARTVSRLTPMTTDPRVDALSFGSSHMQVVQFVYADGHVQAVPVATDLRTLELAVMRNDGEVIPPY